MSILNPIHKHIVAAITAIVMITLPVMAQNAPSSEVDSQNAAPDVAVVVTIDDLFEQLQVAPADQAERIVAKISKIWSDSGSASMDLLLNRGIQAFEAEDFSTAIEHYSALIDHAPDFAQGYNGRAQAYYRAGYYGPALVDLSMVLALNPRHFNALTGMAVILQKIGKPQKALETYRRSLELNPTDKDVLAAISRLEGAAL